MNQVAANRARVFGGVQLARSRLSWFTRGIRRIMKLLLAARPLPGLWECLETDGC